ncbi:MAG: hypothetical protein H0U27_14590, partial [Nitrosopumilus sp.]|nr:hypothetical protein [Nitrosopumilus sp.]
MTETEDLWESCFIDAIDDDITTNEDSNEGNDDTKIIEAFTKLYAGEGHPSALFEFDNLIKSEKEGIYNPETIIKIDDLKPKTEPPVCLQHLYTNEGDGSDYETLTIADGVYNIHKSLYVLPKVQNVVSMVDVNCKLDLKKISLHARNAEYNPKRFAAVIMIIREPKTTALIFASGIMVCT